MRHGGLCESRYYTGVCAGLTTRCCVHSSAVPSAWGFVPWTAALTACLAATTAAVAQPRDQQPTTFQLDPVWSVRLPDAADEWPIVDAHRAYVALRGGSLVAIALGDGRTLWTHQQPSTVPPASDGTRVVVAHASTVEALDVATGDTLWETDLGSTVVAGLTALSGWVIAPLESGEIWALRADSGQAVWSKGLAGPARTTLVAGDAVLAGLQSGTVVSLDILDGSVRWERALGGPAAGLHAADERVYVGSQDNFFYCLNGRSGDVDWRVRTGADLIGRAVSDASRVYFASLDTLLRALDRRTGVQHWKRALPARPLAGPVLVGTLVIVPGLSADMAAYSSRDGKVAGKASLEVELAAPPILVAPTPGSYYRLLILTDDGRLTLLQNRVEPPLEPLKQLPGVAMPLEPPPAPAVVPTPPRTPRRPG
jgi:outer membrane protein assembly factor BamB